MVQRQKKHHLVAALLGAALFCGAPTGMAQEAQGAKTAAKKPRKPKKFVYEGEEIVLVGKIAKPQVQFLISREKGTSEEALELKESFVPKILGALNGPPFK